MDSVLDAPLRRCCQRGLVLRSASKSRVRPSDKVLSLLYCTTSIVYTRRRRGVFPITPSSRLGWGSSLGLLLPDGCMPPSMSCRSFLLHGSTHYPSVRRTLSQDRYQSDGRFGHRMSTHITQVLQAIILFTMREYGYYGVPGMATYVPDVFPSLRRLIPVVHQPTWERARERERERERSSRAKPRASRGETTNSTGSGVIPRASPSLRPYASTQWMGLRPLHRVLVDLMSFRRELRHVQHLLSVEDGRGWPCLIYTSSLPNGRVAHSGMPFLSIPSNR